MHYIHHGWMWWRILLLVPAMLAGTNAASGPEVADIQVTTVSDDVLIEPTTTTTPPPTTTTQPELVLEVAATGDLATAYRLREEGMSWEDLTAWMARVHGLSVEKFLRIIDCESGFNPEVQNPNWVEDGGYPSGMGQHLHLYWPARAERYGIAGVHWSDGVMNLWVTAAMMANEGPSAWECQ